MKALCRIVPFVLATLLAAGAAQASTVLRPVVVELFTSQGCATCPAADAVLGKLAQRPGVIAISLPITYWDMLGWKDTLASEANTRRQKAYAAAMGHGGVYTPQVIVDGVTDVVGSRAAAIEAAILQRRAQLEEARAMALARAAQVPGATTMPAMGSQPLDPLVPVALRDDAQDMHVDIGALTGAHDATVWMFRLRSAVSVNIPTGENAGHTIVYHNVVSDLRSLGIYQGHAISLTLPRPSANGAPYDGIAVIVQQGGYGHILGAAYAAHPDYYAAQ